MIQRRSRLALSAKSFQRLWVASDYFWKEFECNKTVEADIVGLVYHAHATTAKLLDNAVVQDGFANYQVDIIVCVRRPGKAPNSTLTIPSGSPATRKLTLFYRDILASVIAS